MSNLDIVENLKEIEFDKSKEKKLMTHLVLNYPDPKTFENAVNLMFESQVDYLEIQIPFSHPLADGPIIYTANQKALNYDFELEKVLLKINDLRNFQKSPTKLILMSYLTPLLLFGFTRLTTILNKNNFFGLIIPDLSFGSSEHQELNQLSQSQNLELIPVISPLTTSFRIKKILPSLKTGQIVYATARVGQTGQSSDLLDAKIQEYFDFLKKEFTDYKLAIGFGISKKDQVDFLNQQGIIAVIGSKIVNILSLKNPKESLSDLQNFLKELA